MGNGQSQSQSQSQRQSQYYDRRDRKEKKNKDVYTVPKTPPKRRWPAGKPVPDCR